MRFMKLMIPKGYESAKPGTMPANGRRAARPVTIEMIEVRQVAEMSDFPADVQNAAAGFEEMQASSGQRKGS